MVSLRQNEQALWPWWMTELDRQTRGRGMQVRFPDAIKLPTKTEYVLPAGTVLPEKWSYTEGEDAAGAQSAVIRCIHGFTMAVKNPPGTKRLFVNREAEQQFLRQVLTIHMRDYYLRTDQYAT